MYGAILGDIIASPYEFDILVQSSHLAKLLHTLRLRKRRRSLLTFDGFKQ